MPSPWQLIFTDRETYIVIVESVRSRRIKAAKTARVAAWLLCLAFGSVPDVAQAEPVEADADDPTIFDDQARWTADDHGFRLSTKGDPPPFEIALQALLQADARTYFGNAADVAHDEFLMRRMRPRLSGNVYGLVYFKIVTEFGEGDVLLADAMVDVHPFRWLRLTFGKFQPPLGLERLQSDSTIPMVEAAMDANLAVSRDVGGMLWGELFGDTLLYSFGVLDGAPDGVKSDRDFGLHKDLYARLFVKPFGAAPGLGSLGFGMSASAGIRDGTADHPTLSAYKTPGQNRMFNYLSSDTDPTKTVYAQGWHTRLNPQLYYYTGGLGVLAEAVQSRQVIHLADQATTVSNRSWHVTLSYVIGGYNSYDGAFPNHPWDPSHGHFGAVELVGRYSQTELAANAFPVYADPTKSARAAMAFGVTVNWILGHLFRAVIGFERTRFTGGAGTMITIQDRPPENALIARLTLSF